ncbi:MAG: NeuD/PglB/VioB family sugar acetyltransferase [Selenomonadaceae bacterium]|nr:NeuD/PglB/VioB family sugar acetyltransferase [Selenomonadaceae bacterium]
MKNLLIAGAGGFGREVYDMILEMPEFRMAGFLSDVPTALDDYPEIRAEAEIVGTIADYKFRADEFVVNAIGDVAGRKKVAAILRANGANFVNLIHPTAFVSKFARLGEGVIICRGASVSTSTTLGDFVLVNASAIVGHDAEVGAFSVICPQAFVGGFAKIGAECFLGANVSVSPRKILGRGSQVMANSFVARDTQAEAFITGVPGREF